MSKFICLESKKSLFCKATSPQYLSSLQHSRQPNILLVRGAIKIMATLGSKNHDQPQVAGYLIITTNPWKALEPETQGSPSGVPVAFEEWMRMHLLRTPLMLTDFLKYHMGCSNSFLSMDPFAVQSQPSLLLLRHFCCCHFLW